MTIQESAGPGHEPGRWWTPDGNRDLPHGERPAKHPGKLKIHDVTLREAEQGYGVTLNEKDMVRIADELVDVGVRRLEMWPILSDHNKRAMSEISSRHPELDVYALVRPGYQSDLDTALECGAKGAIVFTLTLNDWIAKYAIRQDADQIVDGLVQCVAEAKARGLKVVCGPGDAFRTPEHRLQRLFTEAIEAGADAVSVNDSLGQALPSTVDRLVRRVRGWVGTSVEMEAHCHNDFGMATANTLAAIQAGVDVAEVAINGYGERAGNTSLEEVAVAATALLGLDTGLDLHKLLDMSRLASDVTGIPLPVNKAVVGESLHHIQTGLHAEWRDRVKAAGRPEAWTPFTPEVIGRPGYTIDLGAMAGRNLIRLKAADLGLDVPDEALNEIRDRVKEEGHSRRASVPESVFRKIVAQVLAENALELAEGRVTP